MLFKVIVLVPPSTPMQDIALSVDELMAPYEATDVCGYRGPRAPEGVCRCGYVRARDAAQAIADALYPDPVPGEPDTPERPGEFVRELSRMIDSMHAYEVAFEIMRRHELHSPDCRICAGTGRYPEGMTPEDKFDGRVWGGIYVDGWIRGDPRPCDEPRDTQLADNLTTVAELLQRWAHGTKLVTFALVTPDGVWYEAPNGYWVSTQAERQEFEQGFFERLERHRDCWAVGVECHT